MSCNVMEGKLKQNKAKQGKKNNKKAHDNLLLNKSFKQQLHEITNFPWEKHM